MNTMNVKPPSEWSGRRVILATVVILVVIGSFMLAYRYRFVLIDLFFAVVLSTAIAPMVGWLEKRRVPRGIAEAILFFLIIVIIVGVFLVMVPSVVSQWDNIVASGATIYTNFRNTLALSPLSIISTIGYSLPYTIKISVPQASASAAQGGLSQFGQVLNIGNAFVGGLFSAITLLLLTYYWTLENKRLIPSLVVLFPKDRRATALKFIEAIETKVGGYIRGLLITCVIYGVANGVAFLIMGVPYALVLGILAGIGEAIPVIGGIIGFAPALVIGLTTNPSIIIWMVIAFGVIQVVVNNLLYPRLMDRNVGVSPVVSLLALAAFSSMFGIIGALLAIPLAVIVQLLMDEFLFKEKIIKPDSKGLNELERLRLETEELILDVRKQIRGKQEEMNASSDMTEDNIESIANDLDNLLVALGTDGEEPTL
jgi:predicted PurR-regulated permease PerM